MTRTIDISTELSRDGAEERRLLGRWLEHRDVQARGELLRRLRPVARALAHRYEGSGEPMDDLVQVASIGLMKAVGRFDPTRGFSFSSYAARMAEAELRRYLRDTGDLRYIARTLYERLQAVIRAARRMASRSRRGPTPVEVVETRSAELRRRTSGHSL